MRVTAAFMVSVHNAKQRRCWRTKMSDLKQMLQAASEDHLLADGMLYRRALARIEQLESALKEICSTEKRFTNHGYEIARKALENKDE
jgi:hypothetical protein